MLSARQPTKGVLSLVPPTEGAASGPIDLDEAFSAFIRELRGLVRFDRLAIVLAEDAGARIIATAGDEAEGDLASGAEFSTCEPFGKQLVVGLGHDIADAERAI